VFLHEYLMQCVCVCVCVCDEEGQLVSSSGSGSGHTGEQMTGGYSSEASGVCVCVCGKLTCVCLISAIITAGVRFDTSTATPAVCVCTPDLMLFCSPESQLSFRSRITDDSSGAPRLLCPPVFHERTDS